MPSLVCAVPTWHTLQPHSSLYLHELVLCSGPHLHSNSLILWAILDAIIKHIWQIKHWDQKRAWVMVKNTGGGRLGLQPKWQDSDSLLLMQFSHHLKSFVRGSPVLITDQQQEGNFILKFFLQIWLLLRIFTSFSDFTTLPSKTARPSCVLAENKVLLLMGTTRVAMEVDWTLKFKVIL